jgi:hypothetical protein
MQIQVNDRIDAALRLRNQTGAAFHNHHISGSSSDQECLV